MDTKRIKKIGALAAFSLFLSLALLFSASCLVSGEGQAATLQELLKQVDIAEGEMTIVTKEGQTVKITISEVAPGGDEAEHPHEDLETDNSTESANLEHILPPLNSIEDVFKALGVWEDAHALREKDLTWAHIAAELGYNPDNMYAQLVEIAEVRLKKALEDGIIGPDMMENKLHYFKELAGKWVKEIFHEADTAAVEDILPPLNSIEDVFRALGVWEDAHALKEKGLTWPHIAAELGYNADNMYAQLMDIAEVRLKKALEDGIIGPDMLEKKLNYFRELVGKWVKEIFPDADTAAVGDILPPLNSIEDVFKALGVWEDAHALWEKDLTWGQVASELGYGPDSLYAQLIETAEVSLQKALEAGIIGPDMRDKLLDDFREHVNKWVSEIF